MSIQSINSQVVLPLPNAPLANSNTGRINSAPVGNAADASNAQTKSDVQQKPSAQKLLDAVKSMNDFVDSINSSLKFSVDDKSGQTVVKVVDNETKEVIKQIPSEEVLAMAQAVDKLKGLLVQQKA